MSKELYEPGTVSVVAEGKTSPGTPFWQASGCGVTGCGGRGTGC